MPEEGAESWRQDWRDPEEARARDDAGMAELRADPLGTLRQLTGNWPAFFMMSRVPLPQTGS